MGKERRRREGGRIPGVLGASVDIQRPAKRSRDAGGELAESFRKASKTLEETARDFVALRHRLTRQNSR